MDETLKAAVSAAKALDQVGTRWFLGGSLASSLLGIPRATLDADIVADLRPSMVEAFLNLLGEGWYADESAIREAIEARSSFNIIHLETAVKVDVFLPKRRGFDDRQFARIARITIPDSDGSEFTIPVCSAEDIVVAKLEWYRLGGENSERQWGDILGVLRIHRGRLDSEIIHESAAELGVTDLLTKALRESETESG